MHYAARTDATGTRTPQCAGKWENLVYADGMSWLSAGSQIPFLAARLEEVRDVGNK
jgi:hypothetical protein